jgi:hypothetical protein
MINNIDVTPTQTSLEVKKTKPNWTSLEVLKPCEAYNVVQ